MCGIAGYAGRRPIDTELLTRMSSTLAHRGPDDSGIWTSEGHSAGFAHRRLSIIDVSSAGHQPMSDAAGRVHLTFNGEIYNFRELRVRLEGEGFAFRGQSDTEVIVQAYRRWGASFVEQLDGMFALALYDEDAGELFLARDRAGEKPLFYWRTAERVVFASELKALFAIPEFPRRLDHRALEHYLAFGYVPRELCLVEGVSKLRPAHLIRYRPATNAWQDAAYWTVPDYERSTRSAADLEQELESLLAAAVRRQVVADVPLAVLLSGGVDSSVVTAMAARALPRVRTFTVTFPGHEQFDEARYARLVASHFGTDHTEVPAEMPGFELMAVLARQFDEPIADSSMIPTFLVSQRVREHATVALGGDGGDELFGGYPSYDFVHRLGLISRAVPASLRGLLGAVADRLPARVKGRSYLQQLGRDERGSPGALNQYFDTAARRALLQHGVADESPEAFRARLGGEGGTLLQAALRADFRSYLPDDLLVKIDRASMLASLETRSPLLDRGVVEFAFRHVPDDLKVRLGKRKILLRALARRILPAALDVTRKQGFSIPLAAWLRGGWGAHVREVLGSADGQLFSRPAIDAMMADDASGAGKPHLLFALLMFELWRREYRIEV